MERARGEVVLVTGAQGFLGRHVVRHLRKDETVKEIRELDKQPSDQSENGDEAVTEDGKLMKTYQRDLKDMESCRSVLKDVDVVLHCAALVSYEFPPSKEALRANNVLATENLLKLCIEEGVNRFIYCSTTEVTLQSYGRGGFISVVIYANETKSGTPENGDKLIFGEYAASKLEAEKLVLRANEKSLANGKGVLHTLSLRPSFLYGDGDEKFIGKFLKIGKNRGNSLLRLAGVGGKQQITYVGNAAWAFICAKNALRESPESVAGLPITITDDTPVIDVLRFCQKVSKDSKNCVSPSAWNIPSLFSYLCGWIVEILTNFDPGFFGKLPIAPRSVVAYMGSLILYDRTRASIHLNYDPYYSADESLTRASNYYCKLLDN
ncbi:3 beta-hydroxysteroid dehydrogenase/Delta 5--_4-isomerase type 4 [Venturia canescens]|uniref:3 beta-hydroxysteroid dehydrogenase/Delta 5-->4-isomerase type 4 n=1 Tax=Venturia canescens TaxID=32260 RepID=UPI001C9C6DC6|nr:3 beta-hydroxysteroid dehydrogenase/Delta 5-->4-isomerase type 4 [Venturia canescens]